MRFKPDSNLIFTCKDVDDLLAKNGEKLLTFFNLHRDQQRPRLQELLDYYLTNNRGINKREGRDEPYADYRIAHAFVKNGTVNTEATSGLGSIFYKFVNVGE
ncbi:hypothetical protein JL909_09630 [Staphylococcus pseudintermedius]|nr:hypothetical protein [Staphylococcus pseudintermedius]MCE5662123.1 hypothetical protein [Staphylococcus pseudintermedius]